MPLYKEQGVVLRSHKLGEADKIITILTQGSGKVRGVAKGIRKTKRRFGGRLEPFGHVSLMLYRGRGALDTITQVEIIAPHRAIREDLRLFGAGETMLEAVDKVAEEHERNVKLFLLLMGGLRALDQQPSPAEPSAVAESFLLKLLSVSGFHPSLTACAVCGAQGPTLFANAQGGAVCANCAEQGAVPVSASSLGYLSDLARADLPAASDTVAHTERRFRTQARELLSSFTEYYLERRMKSLPMLEGSLAP
jgi:DNA repair protein RecO (recombination protein O)